MRVYVCTVGELHCASFSQSDYPFHVWLGPRDGTRSAVTLPVFRVGDTLGVSEGSATPMSSVGPRDMLAEVTHPGELEWKKLMIWQ